MQQSRGLPTLRLEFTGLPLGPVGAADARDAFRDLGNAGADPDRDEGGEPPADEHGTAAAQRLGGNAEFGEHDGRDADQGAADEESEAGRARREHEGERREGRRPDVQQGERRGRARGADGECDRDHERVARQQGDDRPPDRAAQPDRDLSRREDDVQRDADQQHGERHAAGDREAECRDDSETQAVDAGAALEQPVALLTDEVHAEGHRDTPCAANRGCHAACRASIAGYSSTALLGCKRGESITATITWGC